MESGNWRFCIISVLRMYSDLAEITESSLTKQLRELEADGFIDRYDFQEVPPHVEYTLTALGTSFISVLDYMKAWGEKNLPEA